MRITRTLTVAVAALTLSGAATAYGALCGDDVDGARVACRCGDVVVSDTTLQATDPVVLERCVGDGLIVRAARTADAIYLNLNGLSLLGSGSGTGIRVSSGGANGAVIDGGGQTARAVIAGFSTGLRASGRRSVAEIRGVELNANRRDGLASWVHEARLIDVVANDNGRDGVHVGGRQSTLDGVRANKNGRYGLRVTQDTAALRGNGKGNRHADVVTKRGEVAQ
jgi:hypothetical protein